MFTNPRIIDAMSAGRVRVPAYAPRRTADATQSLFSFVVYVLHYVMYSEYWIEIKVKAAGI